jgi:hypothetical protein
MRSQAGAFAEVPHASPALVERRMEIEMDYRDIPVEMLRPDVFLADHATRPTRRGLLPLFAALPLALSGALAEASQINPSETQITLPDAIRWSGWINGFPPHSGEMATLYGGLEKPGPYLVLMKWYPAT